MFGIGWTEFVVIALVLLIFVGPKQLPGMLKKVGQVIGELKYASRELRQQVTEEVREIQRDVGDIASPKKIIRNAVDDLVYDMKSPYEEAQQAKDEMKKEITNIKNDFKNIGHDVKKDVKQASGPETKTEPPEDVPPPGNGDGGRELEG